MIGLNLGNLLIHLKADTIQYDRQLKKAVTTMRIISRRIIGIARGMALRVGAMLRRFGHFVGRWVRRLGIALLALGVMSVKAFASFDDAMIKSLAIMGDVSEGMQKEMRDLAMTLSRQGVTSATDLAKSYFFLASAGLTAEQSIAALATVEAFAVAGAFDMAEATDLLTDAQSALGLRTDDAAKNMENMRRVSDVLTGANTLANASTRQFSLALTTQAGPAMKAFNVDLEQGVAVLAAYADQGIKAQRAGTMFSRMLRLMTKGFRDNEAVWKRFNVQIFDSAGELLSMADIIDNLSNAFEGMSTRQRIATLDMLGFQARSQQTILPLLGLGERIREYTKALEKMNGITKEVHEKQLKSFSSQMKILWNNIKSVAMAIGETLAPELVKLSDWFIANEETIRKWSIGFVDRIISIKDDLVKFINFIRTDFHKGLKLGLDISLELFVGFGKGIVAIMKVAAIESADAFIKIFGETLGKWLIKIAIPKGALGKLSMLSPIIAASRIAILSAGATFLEGSQKPRATTNLKEDLKIIIADTKEAIRLLNEAVGIDITPKKEEVRAKGLLEKPFIVELIGVEAIPKELSKAERQIVKWKERIENRLKGMKGAIAETLFGVGYLDPGRIDAVLKAQKDMQKIERLAEGYYGRLAKMKERLLGKGAGVFEGAKESFAEMMALIQGGTFERFQVVRTALVDPRSENITMIDLSRQQLMESREQTRLLRSIDDDDGGG